MSSRIMTGHNQICFALGLFVLMCKASEGRFVNLGQTEAGPNVVCDACLEFSTEAQMIYSNPDAQQQAVDEMIQMACKSLNPMLTTKCVDLVNAYVPDAFLALQAYIGPEICRETGFCNPESPSFITSRGKLLDLTPAVDAKTCIFCRDFAKDALSYFGSNVTKSKIVAALCVACSRLEFITKQLNDITPEEFCEMLRVCKPTHKPAIIVAGVRRNDCAICQFVVLELKLKLRDPATQERLLEVLLSGCNRVQNHVDECKLIVAQYAPFILANLDNILDADALCSKIGACQTHKVEPALALFSEGHAYHLHTHRLVHAL